MTSSSAPTKLPLQFWIITSIAFINAVSFTIIIPTLYPYAKQFGLSDFQASLLTTGYALSQFFATPVLGRLSDRLGRRPILIISLLGTVFSNVLASVASVAWLLFLARILDGITGGNNSIAQTTISDVTDPSQRAKAFGIFGATFRLGFIAGPALSYLALQLPTLPGVTNLGMCFVVSAVIAEIATLLCFFALPESHPPETCTPFKLTWADFKLGKVITSLSSPKFGRLFLLTFLSGSTFTIFAFAFQPFFLEVLGQNSKMLAVAFAIVGILGFIAQVFGLDPLRKRFSLIKILAIALMLRGLLFLLMPAAPNLLVFFVLMGIFGAINSFPMPIIDSLLSSKSNEKEQGEVLGINASYLSISNAIGPAIGGLLVSFGYRVPFFVGGALTLLTGWFALSIQARSDEG